MTKGLFVSLVRVLIAIPATWFMVSRAPTKIDAAQCFDSCRHYDCTGVHCYVNCAGPDPNNGNHCQEVDNGHSDATCSFTSCDY